MSSILSTRDMFRHPEPQMSVCNAAVELPVIFDYSQAVANFTVLRARGGILTIRDENEIIFDNLISVIKQLQSDVSDFKKKLDEIYHDPEKHILTVNAAITIQRRWRYRRSYKEALGNWKENWKDLGCSEYGNQKVMQKIKEEIK